MRTGWIVGGVLACAVAAMLLLGRGGDEPSDTAAAPDSPAGRLARLREGADPGGDVRERRAGEPRAGSGVGPGGKRTDRTGALPGGANRPQRLAPPAGPTAGVAGPAEVPVAGGRQATEREAPEAGPGAFTAGGELASDVVYDGGTEKVFPTDSQEEVGDAGPIAGGAGTVSFWLKADWPPGDQNDATLVQFGDSGLEVVKNVNFLRFQYMDGHGVMQGLGATVGEWSQGEWHHVAASWEGGELALYVDGKLLSQGRYDLPPEFQQETKLYVGSAFPSGAPASQGQITGLQVLNRTAGVGEIMNQFQAGAPPAH